MYKTLSALPDFVSHDNHNYPETLSTEDLLFLNSICEELPKYRKYIDPLSDFGFKKFFGSDANSDLLIAFLNDLFDGKKVIKEISFGNNERQGDHLEDSKLIYDIFCTAENGEQFIIEMQRVNQVFFKDRSLIYLADLMLKSKNMEKSPKGKSNYELPEIYFLGVLDFELDKDEDSDYLRFIQLMNTKTNKVFYDKLSLIFLELPKFSKGQEDLDSNLDKWIFLLKNLSSMKEFPEIFNTQIFNKMINIAEYSKMSVNDKLRYDQARKSELDTRIIMNEYKEQFLEQGIEKGRLDNAKKIITTLLKTGNFSIEEIVSFTGESKELVLMVKNEL